MESHTVTYYRTQVIVPHPNPGLQEGTQFTYPRGMEGWVDLGYPAMEQLGVKLAISQSQVWCPNHYTTEPPNHYTTEPPRLKALMPKSAVIIYDLFARVLLSFSRWLGLTSR